MSGRRLASRQADGETNRIYIQGNIEFHDQRETSEAWGSDRGLFHLTGAAKNFDYENLGHEAAFYASFCSREDIEKIISPQVAHNYLLKLRAEAIVDNPRLVKSEKEKRVGHSKVIILIIGEKI